MSEQKICPTCGTEYPLSERFCPRDGTALRSATAGTDLMGTVVADRYHILKKLGEGGMGQVYLAEHVKMGRKSALKVMNPGMNQDADAIARFNREASNASRLNHPNICAIYDFGETPDGLIYLAMEFIEGQSLTSLVEKCGALPPARAASIIHQSADALQVAHDAGIVHRDLKPDNIMIAKNRDGTDLAKVVDFGIAKAHSSDAQKVTKTGMVVGTPEYMSPEQLSGDKLDGRSDIYSLGLVAFNCLTGKLPFPSDSAQEAMIARLIEQPKTLAEMRPEVAWPAEVQQVMDKALARDSAERYQSAAQFGRELWAACESMPASQAAEAGTQVLSAPASGAAGVPKTRVATPGEGGKTVAGPAAKGAPAAASSGPVAVKKSNTMMIAAAVIGIAVLGGGGYVMLFKDKAETPAGSDSASLAQNPGGPQPATVPAATPATPPGGVKELKTPVNPGRGNDRTKEEAKQQPVVPRVGAPASGSDADALVAQWLPRADELTDGSAQRAINELDPVVDRLTGNSKGNAYYILGAAYFKKNNADDGCAMWTKARPLVSGNPAKVINDFYKELCP
ncbi:MAG: serine/threonine-protein kinase [Gemmatimonadaceae bacterium]|nr:serine/threonine-protein kinase [Gemmatimonadaceae bacterium]